MTQFATTVDHRLTTVDRWSGGGSGIGDGTVPTPRGTTQVVTRGILMIRCQVAVCGRRVSVRGNHVTIMRRLVDGEMTKMPPDLVI
ncbi:hypothetical protein Tco_1327578 [Tanacetum coccineum]